MTVPNDSDEATLGSAPEDPETSDAPAPDGSAAGDAPAPETDPLAELRREKDELQDRLLRTVAEFDNYRKRIDRERRDQTHAAMDDVIEELLPVIDNLERALDAGRCCMNTRCGWGGVARTSRDPPQEPRYGDEVEGSSHV